MTKKKKMLVIGNSKRCFKNIKNFTVDYKSNKKAWMTGEVFSIWLKKWDKQLAKIIFPKNQVNLIINNSIL